jgi:hypothetical protein
LINPLYLQSARSNVRRMLRLPDEEIVDLVVFAAVCCNFDPDRIVPVWLVVVGSPSSGKTDVSKLIRSWKPVWVLPQRITAGYFLSTRNRTDSALIELQKKGSRVLYSDDLAGLIGGDPAHAAALYAAMIGLHDGYLTHSTGLAPGTLTWGPYEPKDRLGFIGSATEKFYEFQERWFQFGSRFMVYFMRDPKGEKWEDYGHLSRIHEMRDIVEHQASATTSTHALLDHIVANIGEFSRVEIDPEDVDRLAAAISLVQRVLGAGRSNDPGVRLHRRVVQLVRMFAFMDGRLRCNSIDIKHGVRIVLSQLPLQEHKILVFALEHVSEPWQFAGMLEAIGSTRKIYSDPLEALVDVGVIRRSGERGNRGYSFELHPKAAGLVDVFDPDKSIFPR